MLQITRFKRTFTATWLALGSAIFILGATPAHAGRSGGGGSLDMSVTTDFGGYEGAADVIILSGPEQKMLVAGDSGMARYNSNGTLDSTFGTGGKVTLSLDANAITLDPDGKILVAGTYFHYINGWQGVYDLAVARYLANGTLDTSFGTNGIATAESSAYFNTANDIALQFDPVAQVMKIVVVGTSGGECNICTAEWVGVRFSLGGIIDSSFGNAGTFRFDYSSGGAINGSYSGGATKMVVLANSQILVTGDSYAAGTLHNFAVIRLNHNGTLDNSFGNSGIVTTDVGGSRDDQSSALAVQPDGKIILGGYTSTGAYTNFALVRYHANGSFDGTFGTGGIVTTDFANLSDGIQAVIVQGDGKILAAGGADIKTNRKYEFDADFALARYMPNGTPDTGFGSAGKVTTNFGHTVEDVRALAIQPLDGKIVAVGHTYDPCSPCVYDFAIARYNP